MSQGRENAKQSLSENTGAPNLPAVDQHGPPARGEEAPGARCRCLAFDDATNGGPTQGVGQAIIGQRRFPL